MYVYIFYAVHVCIVCMHACHASDFIVCMFVCLFSYLVVCNVRHSSADVSSAALRSTIERSAAPRQLCLALSIMDSDSWEKESL